MINSLTSVTKAKVSVFDDNTFQNLPWEDSLSVLNYRYLFKITWIFIQGCQTGGEKVAANIEFHHF